jgi:hypothetical protein
MCIVDQLAQSVIFVNLLESNYITLPKDKVLLITSSRSVQICKKKLSPGKYLF